MPQPPAPRAFLETLLDDLEDAVWSVGQSFELLSWNRRTLEWLASDSPLPCLGATPLDLRWACRDASWWTDRYETAWREGLATATVVHRERTLVLRMRRFEGEPPGILVIAREAPNAGNESSLWTTQARYQTLFENSGTSNVIWDPSGRLVLANGSFSRHLRRSPDQLVGLSFEDLFGTETGTQARERMRQVFQTRMAATFTNQVPLPGGGRWFQTSYNPLFDEKGNPEGVQVIAQDITDLHVAHEKLREREKLESIGILAGGIAHDFNNLLAGLAGHLELVRMKIQENQADAARERLDKAAQVFERAKSLTRQLLTFSKGGLPVREPTILAPLLKEWAEFALSGSDLSLVLDIAPDLWMCDCDALQIAQVVDNLLINARQVSPPGATVLLKAENAEREGPMILVTIGDQGPGINEHNREKLFTPFFTTKVQGSGLGLATSRSIILQHGGTMAVDSGPGGSTFSFLLPALPGRRRSRRHEPLAEFVGHGRVLVMDDEEALRDTLGQILCAFQFEVTRSRNGHDTLGFAQQAVAQGHPYDLFLLDLTIPGGMGGLETSRRIRLLSPEAKIVAMSGYSEEASQIDLRTEGIQGLLVKPFSRKELSDMLHRVFSQELP